MSDEENYMEDGKRHTSGEEMDTFICVHTSDLGDLFEMVLRSYMVNFKPKAKLILVSNDVAALRAFLEQRDLHVEAVLTSDGDWLSEQELALPGWYRQQIIKLRSHQFCETPNFCSLGADTLLLQPIEATDLVDEGGPILYYTSHALPNDHYWYEWLRVRFVARLLKTKPKEANRYVDFINDLFCFSRDNLIGLNRHLESIYGPDYYYAMLRSLNDKSKRFGEWTLYGVYVLDCLNQQCTRRDAAKGFSHQVRTQRGLRRFKFNSKVVHLVSKDFDPGRVRQGIMAHNRALSDHLSSPIISR